MRPYGSMKSNYFPSKKGFTLYMSVIKHPVYALYNIYICVKYYIRWFTVFLKIPINQKLYGESFKQSFWSITDPECHLSHSHIFDNYAILKQLQLHDS